MAPGGDPQEPETIGVVPVTRFTHGPCPPFPESDDGYRVKPDGILAPVQ